MKHTWFWKKPDCPFRFFVVSLPMVYAHFPASANLVVWSSRSQLELRTKLERISLPQVSILGYPPKLFFCPDLILAFISKLPVRRSRFHSLDHLLELFQSSKTLNFFVSEFSLSVIETWHLGRLRGVFEWPWNRNRIDLVGRATDSA